ncbi:MAG TPA: terminase family protein [Solirubrobacteraceae bacterium]|nr:terminase family protein [Solirubrobacteraceae bacterium]
MTTEPSVSLLAACDHAELFNVELWPAQRAILDAIDAGPRIQALCLGRRSGKTFMGALAMLHNCLLSPHLRGMVRPGERRYAVGISTNVRQARLLVAAARSIIESSPALARWVESATEDEIRFRNLTAIAAFPCSSRGGRGWAVSCLVMDEAAFFFSETDGPQAADEVWRALSPSVAQFGDAGRIIVASTPNGPSGFFHDLYSRAQAGALPEARAHHAATSEVNPTITREFLASEAARDPDGYRAEYEAEFVEGGGAFFDTRELELVDAPARPEDGRRWVAGADPAFSRDQWGLAVGPEDVVHPVLLGGWWCQSPSPKEKPDEAAR